MCMYTRYACVLSRRCGEGVRRSKHMVAHAQRNRVGRSRAIIANVVLTGCD